MNTFTKDELTRLRTPFRSNFTKTAKQIEEALRTQPIDLEELDVLISLLSDKFGKLEAADNQMLNLLAKDTNIEQNSLEEEYEKIATYSDKFVSLKRKVDRLQRERRNEPSVNNSVLETVNKKTVRLPKIELPKYDGTIKGWIGFWSLFKKIHDDPDLSEGDKFVYLIQSTAEGSRARDLVESYPPTAENYSQAIDCLKSRFGKDELLIEVYVRELLTLVLNHNKCSLVKLYDKIEAYLRALSTLGVTSDKYAAMLYPLVESCLPDEILKIWERHISTVLIQDKERSEINKLTTLMEFLKSEVEGEQRLAIAKNSFDYGKETHHKSFKRCVSVNDSNVPTASGLLNTNEVNGSSCIFCSKRHNSAECNKAKNMSLEDRRNLVKKAACCFKCLKRGHVSKQCYSRTKCFCCHKFHCAIMCPSVTLENKVGIQKKVEELDNTQNKDQALSVQSNKVGILLQTLQVFLRGRNNKHIVRVLIDTGSQHSYISSKAVKLLNYECVGEIPIIHSLFGGIESPQKRHRCFRAYLTSLDETYNCNFEVLEQDQICGDIKKTLHGKWMSDLCKMGINLTDVVTGSHNEVDSEIHLLIGADVAGKLLNGRIHELKTGPVAVGTRLGWTLMGKIPRSAQMSESCLSIISLLTRNVNLPDFWSHDRMGITVPAVKSSSLEHELPCEEPVGISSITDVTVKEKPPDNYFTNYSFEKRPGTQSYLRICEANKLGAKYFLDCLKIESEMTELTEPPLSLSSNEANKLRTKLDFKSLNFRSRTCCVPGIFEEDPEKLAELFIKTENINEMKRYVALRGKLEEKERATEHVNVLKEINEDFGVGAIVNAGFHNSEDSVSHHLKGLPIEHAIGKFEEDIFIILTLKDKSVQEEDVLGNVDVKINEGYAENDEVQNKKPDCQAFEMPKYDVEIEVRMEYFKIELNITGSNHQTRENSEEMQFKVHKTRKKRKKVKIRHWYVPDLFRYRMTLYQRLTLVAYFSKVRKVGGCHKSPGMATSWRKLLRISLTLVVICAGAKRNKRD